MGWALSKSLTSYTSFTRQKVTPKPTVYLVVCVGSETLNVELVVVWTYIPGLTTKHTAELNPKQKQHYSKLFFSNGSRIQ